MGKTWLDTRRQASVLDPEVNSCSRGFCKKTSVDFQQVGAGQVALKFGTVHFWEGLKSTKAMQNERMPDPSEISLGSAHIIQLEVDLGIDPDLNPTQGIFCRKMNTQQGSRRPRVRVRCPQSPAARSRQTWPVAGLPQACPPWPSASPAPPARSAPRS